MRRAMLLAAFAVVAAAVAASGDGQMKYDFGAIGELATTDNPVVVTAPPSADPAPATAAMTPCLSAANPKRTGARRNPPSLTAATISWPQASDGKGRRRRDSNRAQNVGGG